MGRAFRVGRLAGIQWNIHWTFLLLMGWLAAMQWSSEFFLNAVCDQFLFVLLLAICLLAHELGHVLAGLQFGLQTQEITLLPIGGVRRSRELSASLFTELCIACAGVLVHVVIALGLATALSLQGLPLWNTSFGLLESSVPAGMGQRLMVANFVLAAVHLLPAFPMDGGRVLRVWLAKRMQWGIATAFAAKISQGLAGGLALVGLLGHPILLLLALVIYLGARAETSGVRYRTRIADLEVRDAMIGRIACLRSSDDLRLAGDSLLQGMQQDFPVTDASGRFLGMLYRSTVITSLQLGLVAQSVEQAMLPGTGVAVEPHDSLGKAMRIMNHHGVTSLPVTSGQRVMGLLTQERLFELMISRGNEAANGTRSEGAVASLAWLLKS